MRNVHDVGGQLGWGPVPRAKERTFHADWERGSFGLTLAAIANGFLNNVDENRYAKERMRPHDLLRSSYFELWLASLEMNLVENGVLDFDEICRLEQEALAGTLEEESGVETPELTSAIDGLLGEGGRLATTGPAPRQFAVGDRVRVDQPNSRKHSRVPGYAMGRVAVVTAVLPAYPVPQVVAHGLGDHSDWCYTVRFDAAELWRQDSRREAVYLDVWETDLYPDLIRSEPTPPEANP